MKTQDQPKAKYPPNEGWIKMELTLNSSKQLSEDEIKQVATFGKPHLYNFGPVRQMGRKIFVTTQEKAKAPVSQE